MPRGYGWRGIAVWCINEGANEDASVKRAEMKQDVCASTRCTPNMTAHSLHVPRHAPWGVHGARADRQAWICVLSPQ